MTKKTFDAEHWDERRNFLVLHAREAKYIRLDTTDRFICASCCGIFNLPYAHTCYLYLHTGMGNFLIHMKCRACHEEDIEWTERNSKYDPRTHWYQGVLPFIEVAE